MKTVAALYVEPAGCYVGQPAVDPWDEARDARCDQAYELLPDSVQW